MTKYSLAFASVICLILGCCLLLGGCSKSAPAWPKADKTRVLVTFPALYCFVKNVAGDDADVRCLLTTTGPHDYAETGQDVELARAADVIFLIGLELDEFIYQLLKKEHKARAVEVGEAIPKAQLKRSAAGGHMHKGHVHEHGDYDPHVWLGPPQAKAMVAAIAAKLGEVDPQHKKGYDDRAKDYQDKLDKLQADGQALFKDKKSRALVSMHDSLQYFADAFGLTVEGNIQPRPGMEADAAQMSALVKLCKDKQAHVIAVEPQYSTGLAKSLQSQLARMKVPVQIVEVDPLETAPAATGKAEPAPGYYLERMRKNLTDLAKALE